MVVVEPRPTGATLVIIVQDPLKTLDISVD